MELRIDNISKKYKGRTVVSGVSLHIAVGEVVGLLGTNGAGKTTTFYTIVGLIKPDGGKVFLDKTDITHLPMYKRAQLGIGYLPQENSIFKGMSVEDNLYCVLELLPLNKKQRREKAEELLEGLHITHVRKSKGYALSGGERKRAEIARALVMSPRFMLFDEPFAGVDPISVGDIQALIAGLAEKNIGILISDHNVRETFGVNKRSYIMNQGVLLAEGTPQELSENELVRKTYLGENFSMG